MRSDGLDANSLARVSRNMIIISLWYVIGYQGAVFERHAGDWVKSQEARISAGAIDVAPVANTDNQDNATVVFYGVDNAVRADPEPKLT